MSRRALLCLVGAAILVASGLVGAVSGPVVPTRAADAATSSAATSSAATSSSVATAGLAYVALGDSYAAGYGLAKLTGEPVAACAQSSLDYPHRVAEALGLDLTDVSCAGATTADVVDREQLGAAPQVDALSTKTRLVTISIGGNDAGLFSTASSCIALSKTGPIFGAGASTTNCRSEYIENGRDTLTRDIETTTEKGLTSAFAAIERRAPNARVVVVGYPAVFPDRANTPATGCYRAVVDAQSLSDGFPKDGFPFTATDVAYLAGVQATLDTVTKKAADAAGFTYVSTLAASQAHSGCATSGSYIEGISLTAGEYFKSISLETGALHPNARGVAFLAAKTSAAAATALAPTAAASPSAEAGARNGGRSPELVWIALAAALVAVFTVAIVANRARRRRAHPSPPDRR